MHLSSLERPWEPVDVGNGMFVLTRQRRGDTSALEHFRGNNHEPLFFDATDAAALAGRLNEAPAALRPRVHW